ncbi:MAG: FG-GAP-like repeat-containing protein [Myxococcota bacterium]
MSPRHLLALFGALIIVASTGCGSGDSKCFEDSTCPHGNRCVLPGARGAAGVCKPCDATELPYDGIDNDCNALTKDNDLDGDGDNSKTSATDPGGDCDDMDPAVSSKQAEICGDMKDNNCDGRVDEPECADHMAPSVSVLTPTQGSTVSGMVTMTASAMDDVGMARVDFLSETGMLLGSDDSPPFEVRFDSSLLPDGPIDLTARGFDRVGKRGEGTVHVYVENRTGPRVVPVRPVRDGSYGGRMTIDLSAWDPQGVASLKLSLDSMEIATTTTSAVRYPVDTRTMAEGPHVLVVEAVDSAGSRSQTTLSFLVDNQPPGARMTGGPASGTASGTVPLTITATDASSVRIGILGQTFLSSPATYPLVTTNYYNGSLTVTATVTDTAIVDDGASPSHSLYVSRTFNISNQGHTAPTVDFTAPLDGGEVYLDTVIAAKAVLANQTLDRLEFYADGALIGVGCSATAAPGYQQAQSMLGCEIHWNFRTYSGPVHLRAVAHWASGATAVDDITVTAIAPVRFEGADQVLARNAVDSYAVADIDGDGHLDLRTCAAALSATYNGRGASGLAPLAIPGERCAHVLAGDFDGDGVGDYVNVDTETKVYVHSAGGMEVVLNGIGFAVGDINGDRRSDVLTYDASGSYAYLGTASGIGPAQPSGLPPAEGLLVDVDLDGDLDAMFPQRTVDQFQNVLWSVDVYLNDGQGNFSGPVSSPIAGPVSAGQPFPLSIAIMDYNHDGLGDLVQGTPTGVLVYPGASAVLGSFGAGASVPGFSRLSTVVSADLDEDGNADLIVLEDGILSVITFAGSQAKFVAPNATSLVVADVTGDQHLDLLTSGNEFALVHGNGDGTVGLPRIIGPVPVALTAVDLVGDSKPELLAVTATGSLELFSANGRVFRHDSGRATGAPDAVQIAAGRLGGTGKADLAVASAQSVHILRFNAAGDFTPLSPTSVAGARVNMIIADVDTNGTAEVVIPTSRGLNLVAQDGAASVAAPMLQISGNVEVADFDGDGVNDILTESGTQLSLTHLNPVSSRTISSIGGHFAVGRLGMDALPDLFLAATNAIGTHAGDPMRGLATLQRTTQTFGAVLPHSNLVADLNGDGLGDLLVFRQAFLGAVTDGAQELLVLLGNSQGGFRPPVSYPVRVPQAANRVLAAGDFDGDGKIDLAVLTSAGVTLLRNATP